MWMHRTLTLALCLGLAGCAGPSQPGHVVQGTVRYPGGAPVELARVRIEGGAETFTNAAGKYRLPLPSSGSVIRVLANDGYTPGRAYATTHSGWVEVPRQPDIVADVVLDHAQPF